MPPKQQPYGRDLLILLSDIKGIYDKNPATNSDAKLIELVTNPYELEEGIDISEKSSFGTGGIATKIEAAKILMNFGTSLIVARGKEDDIIVKLSDGRTKGTLLEQNLSKKNCRGKVYRSRPSLLTVKICIIEKGY